MFRVQGHKTLHEGLSTSQSFLHMAQGTFKLPGGRPEEKDACPKEQPLKLATRVTSYPEVALAMETGPTTRWVGLETLVDVMLQGCKVSALADSGSQVNTMMLEFVQEWGYPVLTPGWTCELSPASGWTWWLMHMSLGIHNCEAAGQRSGRV